MNLLQSNISVPRLQRDYVQGINQNIIRPFIDDLMNGNETIDLNYIYGTQNETHFQPIDGQQRLTTLWLLRLCLSKVAEVEYDISLQYDAREYANEFCKKLLKASVDDIQNPQLASWYLKSWNDDPSVVAMNSTIAVIWKYMPDNKKDALKILNSLIERLQYCYLPLGNDINEDVYIKMNRRGVQLTAFENLKSWLDKQVEDKNDAEFAKKWKESIDGPWAAMMWDLVDKSDMTKDISIDDLMLNCIYSFVHCYLSRNKDLFNQYFDNDDDKENKKQNASFILDIPPSSNILESCLERISSPRNKMRLELYQLDILPIFTTESMQFIYKCMERLCKVYKFINKCCYNFYSEWQPSSSESLIAHLINENTYQSRTLLYAFSAFEGSEFTSLDSWIYRIRNLVINTEIGVTTIQSIILSIDSLASLCSTISINDALALKDKNNIEREGSRLTGFSKKQLHEEYIKSELNSAVWTEVKIIENHPFFLGRVSFLFDFAGEYPSLEKISPYCFYMKHLFNEKSFANGIGNSLRLAMLSLGWFGFYGQYGNWSFLKTKEEKQKFIYDNTLDSENLLRNTPHNYVLQGVIDKLYNEYGLVSPTSKMLQQIGKQMYEKIPNNDSRKYFSYIQIWDLMEQHQLRSNGETVKLLFEKTKGNCNRIDLWNYRLYIDWTSTYNKKEDETSQKKYEVLFPGWSFDKWTAGDESCVYLEKSLANDEKLAIDIWHDPQKYDWFGISIFIRDNKQATINILWPILKHDKYGYTLNNDRYVSKDSISREILEDYLVNVIKNINEII